MELAKVRKSFGLSQNDIVKITGLSKSMVSMIDKGERQLNSESEQLLVDYLHRKPKADITAMIDYLVIRVKTLNYKKFINEVLKIPDYYFEQGQSGGNGYPFRVEYGEIKVFYHNENIDMGARIEFKGGACRLFETFLEEQNRTWQDFLKDVINYSFEATRINGVDDPIEARKFLKFKRLDIALDERFNEKGFIRFNFYEKDLEQAFRRNIPVEDVQEIFGFKNRYEIRLKDDKAFQVIEDFVGWEKTPETLYDLGVGIIMDYLQVFDETGRPDRSWYEVFGQGKKYKFITQPKIESLEKRRAWFDRQLKRNLYIEARISRETGRSYVEELISEYDPDDEDEKIIRRDVERIKNRDFEHEARSTPEGQAFLKALGK
ncbi:replication initiation factor domain-containing protein [Lactococcus lactis subsp. lactis]|uniref:replication initiation factor domain-containing protein n=1 Tax=Lactococcus lactis TaxID=1358 RepID=UPI0009C248B0|nr:replication initiation factor domain-containing protein [Lactococcus lactis]ARD94540.1 Replication initiation factor [Lactococcus lactis subsp. lactis]MRL66088.1 replication initiation protein [Lactococcus lactis subsp. lactis]